MRPETEAETGAAPHDAGPAGPAGPIRVAFQGAPGAFSEEALLSYFGTTVAPLPCRGFADVVEAVQEDEAARGVLPVENTLAGSVTAAYDALASGPVTIVGEIIWPIRHFLLGVPGSRPAELRRILSHPVALAQCTRFLSAHEQAEAVAVYDTAGAAREVAERGDPSRAAVAARGAAERYGLEILASDIQDRDDNQTRFYVIRLPEPAEQAEPPREAPHRTVVVLEVKDRPGSLMDVLAPFARREINLSKLESRPAEVPWRYRFLLELDAHRASEAAAAALAEVEPLTSAFRVLGSFPAADRSPARGRT